ncbi:MAG: magnesium and cobalt transport protein CorA [Anaerosporomusa subterranea]|jgi:magnesium transporter|nr:magnesium and cobalt transport protein CorA [Anaerosporomusa subterranea]
MPKHKTSLAKKIGLPPGTLLHTGLTRETIPELTVISYNTEEVAERKISPGELSTFRERTGITWLHVKGTYHVPTIEVIGEAFGLHPLVLEDILTPGQRPKLEDYGEYSFFVLMSHTMVNGCLVSEQVSIVLGADYVLSFQDEHSDLFKPVAERLLNAKGRMRKFGPDYLAYSLIDMVVDHFFGVLEHMGEFIEMIEQEVVANPQPSVLHDIHELKTQMLFLRKAVWPLRELIGALERGQLTLFRESTLLYVRDVYDHTAQVIETLEMYREMVSGLLDVYLSSLSNKMNEVIKMLTILSTLFMPLTFVVGLYGMNFKYMPELEWEWGYPVVLSVLGVMTCLMLWFFRRRRWI